MSTVADTPWAALRLKNIVLLLSIGAIGVVPISAAGGETFTPLVLLIKFAEEIKAENPLGVDPIR